MYNNLIDVSFWKLKIEKTFQKYNEENDNLLSSRWYHLNPYRNTVKIYYYRYKLDKNELPISRTWETVTLPIEF